MKGTVQLNAKLDYWYRPYNYHGDEPMVTQTLNVSGHNQLLYLGILLAVDGIRDQIAHVQSDLGYHCPYVS